MNTTTAKLRRTLGGFGVAALAAGTLVISTAGAANAATDIYLCARGSSASVANPDGGAPISVPFYGFTQVNAAVDCPSAVVGLSDPAPVRLTEGEEYNVIVVNHTGYEINFSSAGLTGPPDLVGVAASPGSTKTYTFTADTPGTYMYESDLDPRHSLLGLHGVVVVDPLTPGSAHGDAVSEYDVEQIVVLSEVDLELNGAVDPFAVSLLDYEPDLFLLNGQTHTESSPIPPVVAAAGERVLVRYVNAAPSNSSMAALGLRQSIVGFDGEIHDGTFGVAAEAPQDVSQVFLTAGQTADAILTMGGPVGDQIPLYNRNLRTTATGNNGAQLMMLEVGAGGLTPTANVYFSIAPGSRSNYVGLAQVLHDEDIAMWNPTAGAVTIEFDGSDHGLGLAGADIDAVHVGASGNIYFSLRADVAAVDTAGGPLDALGALEESDIFMWDGTDVTRYLDGATIGLNGSNRHDINALHIDEATGLVYFSTNGTIRLSDGVPTLGGVIGARNEDVLVYDPATDLVSAVFDGQDFGLALESIDGLVLDGSDLMFSLTTEFPNTPQPDFDRDDLIACLGFAPAAPGTTLDTCSGPLSLELDGDVTHTTNAGNIDGYSLG